MKFIDLFCGAGGATAGIQATNFAQVIACINHDPKAIRSHQANHPECEHYIEDIRLFNEKKLPKCDAIWMSAECTHISKAKGGKSRNPDSRTLSFEIFRYAKHCEPNYIIVENLMEILTWGPTIQKKNKRGELMFEKDGSPIMVPDKDPEKLGSYYRYWVKTLKEMGYVNYSYKMLNAADFGEYTARNRYFGIFSKKGFPIRFPSPTHHKTGAMGLPKWKAVKDVLNFNDLGDSIFHRKRHLCEKTMKRIYAGLVKFSGGSHIMKYNSNNAKTGTNSGASLDVPCHTITTQKRLGLVQTITPSSFLDPYYGTSTPQSLEKPCNTLTTKDTFSLIQPFHLNNNYKQLSLSINETDGYYMKKVKEFCIKNRIMDVYQRMLRVDEMKVIQGFNKDYILEGTQEDKIKFIGNSVVPGIAQRIVESLQKGLKENKIAA